MNNQAEVNRTSFIAAAENIAIAEDASARARQIDLVAKAEPLIEKLTELKNYYRTFNFRSEKYKSKDYLTIRFTKGLRTADMLIPGVDFRYYALFVYPDGTISFGLAETFKGMEDKVIKSFETTEQAIEHLIKELAHRDLLKAPVRSGNVWFNPFRFFQKKPS